LAAMFAVFVHPAAALVIGAGLTPVVWSGSRARRALLRALAILGGLLALVFLPVAEAIFWLRAPFRPEHPGSHQAFRGGFDQLLRDWWTHLFDTQTRRDGAGGLLLVLPLAARGALSMVESDVTTTDSVNARRRIARQAILVTLVFCAVTAYVLPSF